MEWGGGGVTWELWVSCSDINSYKGDAKSGSQSLQAESGAGMLEFGGLGQGRLASDPTTQFQNGSLDCGGGGCKFYPTYVGS